MLQTKKQHIYMSIVVFCQSIEYQHLVKSVNSEKVPPWALCSPPERSAPKKTPQLPLAGSVPTITSSSSSARREGRLSTPTAARRLQLCWGCSWLINLPQELSADAWPCFLSTGCMFPSIVLLLGDKRLLLGLGKGVTAVLTVGLLSLYRGLLKSFGAQQVWRKRKSN